MWPLECSSNFRLWVFLEKCGDMGMLWSTLRAEGSLSTVKQMGCSRNCYPKLNYAVGLGRGTLRLELAARFVLELEGHNEDALLQLQPGLEQWKLRLLEYGSQPISAHNQSLLTQIQQFFPPKTERTNALSWWSRRCAQFAKSGPTGAPRCLIKDICFLQ